MRRNCLPLFFLLLLSVLQENGALDLNFQQNDYVVKFERAEAVSKNDQYVKRFECISFKYNRTLTVANLTLEMKQDFNNDLQFVAQVYKFASNEYRHFPLRLQLNFCEAVAKNTIGLSRFKECGTFRNCPLKKNTRYHFCNFYPDDSHFPPRIPSGQYMLDLQGTYNDIELFVLKAYGTISRPIKP